MAGLVAAIVEYHEGAPWWRVRTSESEVAILRSRPDARAHNWRFSMTGSTTTREYAAGARSTDTFGRVLCSARTHHFVVDGPAQNGCPGEEITPPEAFLSGVASCGVELMQVIARDEGTPLESVSVQIRGTVDRANQRRSDVTTFNRVELDFVLTGPDEKQAAALIEGFKRR
jgi:uncharacterized OsmC-like protein